MEDPTLPCMVSHARYPRANASQPRTPNSRSRVPGQWPGTVTSNAMQRQEQTQHNTTQHNTTQQNRTEQNRTQHSTTQHNTTQHNTTHAFFDWSLRLNHYFTYLHMHFLTEALSESTISLIFACIFLRKPQAKPKRLRLIAASGRLTSAKTNREETLNPKP